VKFTDPNVRPKFGPPLLENIPAELQAIPQWVPWRFDWNPHSKQWAKVPYDVQTLRPAKSNDSSTWASFDKARIVYVEGKNSFDGLGFVFSINDEYCGIDFDECFDVDGAITDPLAKEWIERLDSYTEKSVSGTGAHVIVKGVAGAGLKRGKVEIYDRGRYFTFSGDVGKRREIHRRQKEIEDLQQTIAPPQSNIRELKLVRLEQSCPEIIEKAFKSRTGESVRRLYEGDIAGYGSQSEADQALCSKLAFWSGGDPVRLDSMFRGSRLFREKWDERHNGNGQTYGEMTIEKALSGCAEFYKGNNAERTTNHAAHESDYQAPWPTLDPKALYGLAGDIARTIEPHTEADPVALIVQVFAAYGNVIGRTAYFSAEADRHYTNLYVVLVGRTSKGRKGTSWSHVRKLFARVDENWSANCVFNGLSSGEGVIHHLRDKSEKKEPVKEKGKVVSYQTVIVDHGVDDKRAFIIETEFGSVIVVMSRQGVTLSAILRQGWDGVTLRVMSRNTAAIATGALISIVGHITSDELTRNLDQTERANGFANRFLWPLVRRSKFLPEGGSPGDSELNPLIERLNEAIRFGRSVRELKRDEQAAALWREVYPQLSEGHKGMLGVVTSRAEAQTMRLACLYALLDGSDVIRRVHLEAALALWQYCEDSAKYIFGDSLGDRLADETLSALREASDSGLTRSQIRDLFGRNKDADKIAGALKCLAENGLAHTHKEQGPNGGRPIERWFATSQVVAKEVKPSDAVFEDLEIDIPLETAYA
jgi:hypothetical protein